MTALVLQIQDWDNSNTRDSLQKTPGTILDVRPSHSPRHIVGSDDTFKKKDSIMNTHVSMSKAKLPPRSRFGCWTCRTRKVKCDELKPQCTPCSRLGHSCDYNPRVSFKDDTVRVVAKMNNSVGRKGPAWNPQQVFRLRQQPPEDDLLPPFNSLDNDEEREMKAKYRKAGTYYVVANSESFWNCDEYRGLNEVHEPGGFDESGESILPLSNILSDRLRLDGTNSLASLSNDPDVLILRAFEEDISQDNPRSDSKPSKSAQKFERQANTPKPMMSPTSGSEPSRQSSSSPKTNETSEQDRLLKYHFKTFVVKHLNQAQNDFWRPSTESMVPLLSDLLLEYATICPALYHALMSLSAISLSQQGISRKFDVAALQHYQQAIPSLQRSLQAESDLASDGVFLTHFILLLCEIVTVNFKEPSLLSTHISQLQRIVSLRKGFYKNDPLEFLVWWITSIDTFLVFSGVGHGEYIQCVFGEGILSSDHGSELTIHRRMDLFAAKMACLGRDLRAEENAKPRGGKGLISFEHDRRIGLMRQALCGLQQSETFRSIVESGQYDSDSVDSSPQDQVVAFLCMLNIFSHTSMYPSQRCHKQNTIQIIQPRNEILRLAREIVGSGHYERKFIVFPLFLAGTVSQRTTERREILELMSAMEQNSVCKNVTMTRRLLETYFERADKESETDEDGLVPSTDWVALSTELGMQAINCWF